MKREIRLHRGEFLAVMVFLVFIPMLAGLAVLDHNHGESVKAEARRSNERLALSQASDAWARYDGDIAACLRGRKLRIQLNDNFAALQGVAYLFSAFLDDSALVRLQLERPALSEKARVARDAVIRNAERLKPVKPTVCKEAIERPKVARPGGGGK